MKKHFLKRILTMGMACVMLLTGAVPAEAAYIAAQATLSGNKSLFAWVEKLDDEVTICFSSKNLKTKKTTKAWSDSKDNYLNYSNNAWYQTVLTSYDASGNKLTSNTYYMAKSPKLNSLKLYKGKRKIKVSWPKTSGATGYVVYMKTGSGSYKIVKKPKKNYYVTSKLKYYTNYYFYVLSYKKVGGKTWYSALPEDRPGGYIYYR